MCVYAFNFLRFSARGTDPYTLPIYMYIYLYKHLLSATIYAALQKPISR